MAKYHINNEDQVLPCRAKVKCKFGGATGMERHFGSKQDAEEYVQKKLSMQYSSTSSYNKSKNQIELNKLNRDGVEVKKINHITEHRFATLDADSSPSTIDLLDEKPTPLLLAEMQKQKFVFGK